MGIDIKLCVNWSFNPEGVSKQHLDDMFALRLTRDYELFELLREVDRVKLPKTAQLSLVAGGYTRQDAYGSDLTYTTIGLIKTSKELRRAFKRSSDWNQGVFALLKRLNKKTPIVFYWH